MNELVTVSRLNRFVEAAKNMGYEIRQELLDGTGAAICHIKGKPILFLDLSSGPAEQLEAIKRVLSQPDSAETAVN